MAWTIFLFCLDNLVLQNTEHVDNFPFEAVTTISLLTFPKQVCFQTSQKTSMEKEEQIW